MNKLVKLYYKLTKYMPRPLPQTDAEFLKLKEICQQAYGLEDHPKYTYTLASQLMAGQPTSLYRSYGSMVNAAIKLNIAALTQWHKQIASDELYQRLEAKTKEVSDAIKEEEAKESSDTREIKPTWSDVPGQPHPPAVSPQHLHSVVQELSVTPQGVVQPHSHNGL